MNALLEPHVAQMKQLVENLRLLKNSMRKEQKKAAKITAKNQLIEKETQRLANIKKTVGRYYTDAQGDAASAQSLLDHIIRLRKDHNIKLNTLERRTIFKLGQWRREYMEACTRVHRSFE